MKKSLIALAVALAACGASAQSAELTPNGATTVQGGSKEQKPAAKPAEATIHQRTTPTSITPKKSSTSATKLASVEASEMKAKNGWKPDDDGLAARRLLAKIHSVPSPM